MSVIESFSNSVMDDPVLICAVSLETIILNAYHISIFAFHLVALPFFGENVK